MTDDAPTDRLVNSINVLIRRMDMLMTPLPRATTDPVQPFYMSGRWWRRDGNGYGLSGGAQPANYPFRKVPV